MTDEERRVRANDPEREDVVPVDAASSAAPSEGAEWTREQLEIDDGPGDPDAPGSDAVTDRPDRVPGWNISQMEIDDAGETPRRIDPSEMGDSAEGPTGGKENPGGGERFGMTDDDAKRD